MPSLLIKSVRSLSRSYREVFGTPRGPLFNWWLPDGEKDALTLCRSPNAQLKVWFERRGFVRDGFIQYDSKRREVDAGRLARQSPLDAGPLVCLLELSNVSDDERRYLSVAKRGDEKYIEIGKSVVQDLLYPYLPRFVDILRTNFGQYWLDPIEKWDSRTRSLGSYCVYLALSWSHDRGATWQEFIPDDPLSMGPTIVVGGRKENIGKEDWQELGHVMAGDYKPLLAARVLSEAHRLLDEDNMRFSLVEGVAALELAIREFIERTGGSTAVAHSSRFLGLPLKEQLVVLTAASGKVPSGVVDEAVKAIDMRNEAVHEGFTPPPEAGTSILALLKCAASFLGGPKFRFPPRHQGKVLLPTGADTG